MIFFLAFYNLVPSLCFAKDDSNNKEQTSKPKTSATEKNTDKSKAKTETPKKDNNPTKNKTESNENTNKTENDSKSDESQKENSEENTIKSKSSVPKMNSILPEKSTSEEQTKDDSSENKDKEFSEIEFNLPEVKDSELEETLNSQIPESTPPTRDLPKTIMAWILIACGVALILAAIILNLKMPNDMNFRYHEKHKSKSRKNKYNFRYK